MKFTFENETELFVHPAPLASETQPILLRDKLKLPVSYEDFTSDELLLLQEIKSRLDSSELLNFELKTACSQDLGSQKQSLIGFRCDDIFSFLRNFVLNGSLNLDSQERLLVPEEAFNNAFYLTPNYTNPLVLQGKTTEVPYSFYDLAGNNLGIYGKIGFQNYFQRNLIFNLVENWEEEALEEVSRLVYSQVDECLIEDYISMVMDECEILLKDILQPKLGINNVSEYIYKSRNRFAGLNHLNGLVKKDFSSVELEKFWFGLIRAYYLRKSVSLGFGNGVLQGEVLTDLDIIPLTVRDSYDPSSSVFLKHLKANEIVHDTPEMVILPSNQQIDLHAPNTVIAIETSDGSLEEFVLKELGLIETK